MSDGCFRSDDDEKYKEFTNVMFNDRPPPYCGFVRDVIDSLSDGRIDAFYYARMEKGETMLGPVGCLLVGIFLIISLILVLRFHAFLALISAAIVIALLSDRIPIENALPLVATEFGGLMGNIGILLAMAAIIGKCLMDSGAAERIVRAFSRMFGKDREHYSLLSSSFVLSIPVFFDTVFYLLAPLARAVFARRKRDYILIVCATAAGGAITHALVPPTPGPIIVAEALDNTLLGLIDSGNAINPYRVSIATTILVGIIVSIVPVIVGGLLYAKWANRWMHVQPSDALGVSQEELEQISEKPDSELPGLLISFLPFVLPVVLLAGSAIASSYIPSASTLTSVEQLFGDAPQAGSTVMFHQEEWTYGEVQRYRAWQRWIKIAGDKNLTFFLGALIGIYLLYTYKHSNLSATFKMLEPAIASGAVIAFITCAGGSFGKVLAASGVGIVIEEAARQWGLSLLVLSFLSATLIRIAQGSATVAMVTTVGIIAPSLATIELAYHPVYLVAVIGFGATGFSWMNDSGFWIFGQLTGLSETQTLKTWTVMLTLMALAGFLWTLLLSSLMPFPPLSS